MIITKVTRTHSRSINTRSYGSKIESWVKKEATYTADIESGDDPIKVSEMVAQQAEADVNAGIGEVIEKIKAANPNTIPANMAQAGTVAPVTAPRAL